VNWPEFQHGPALAARYGGECPECGEEIEPGETIIMTDDGATHAGCVDHEECPEGSTCGTD
jgi:hypothetical protein